MSEQRGYTPQDPESTTPWGESNWGDDLAGLDAVLEGRISELVPKAPQIPKDLEEVSFEEVRMEPLLESQEEVKRPSLLRHRPHLGTSNTAGMSQVKASTRSAPALAFLRHVLGDDDLVHSLASTYPSWNALVQASSNDLGQVLGHKGYGITLPKDIPPLPALGPGVSVVTRYQLSYPQRLRDLPTPPVLLYYKGTLPTRPMVCINSADSPSPLGVAVARDTARIAAAQDVPVVVAAAGLIPTAVVSAAVEAGGRVVLVLPHGIDAISSLGYLQDLVLTSNGAVVSPLPPDSPVGATQRSWADRVAVGLATSVMLNEVGLHTSAGADGARAAIVTARYLIVPRPEAPEETGRHIPTSAFGLAVLSSAKEFTSEYYGSNARIDTRCANGLPPADAVVESPAEIAIALAVSCPQGHEEDQTNP